MQDAAAAAWRPGRENLGWRRFYDSVSVFFGDSAHDGGDAVRPGGSPEKICDAPAWATLIAHPDGLVLVDCGCQQLPQVDPEAAHIYSYQPDELITTQLQRLGHTPDDVTHLILTHSHVDHAGNTCLFRKAKIYIDAAEYAGALEDRRAYLEGRGTSMPAQHLGY